MTGTLRRRGNRQLLTWLCALIAAVSLLRWQALVGTAYLNAGYIALMKRSDQHALNGQWDAEAQVAFASAEQWGAHDGRVTAAQGRLALLSDKPAEAIVYLSQAIRRRYQSQVIHFQLGLAFERIGDDERAIAEWQQAHVAAYFVQRGLVLRHQKDWRGAEAALRRATLIEPTNGSVWRTLGIFYWEWGERANALACLRRALLFENDPYERPLLQGEVAMLEGDLNDAERFLRDALRLQPTRPEAYARLADVADQRGDAAAALAILKLGIQNAPQDLGLALGLGVRLSGQMDFAAADRIYADAHWLDPRSDEPLLLRGQNALAWGKEAEAEMYIQQALRLSPNNAESHLWLGKLMTRRGDWAAVCAEYRRAATLASDDPAYQLPADLRGKCNETP